MDEYMFWNPIRLKGEPDLEIEITDVDLHERLISLSEEEQQLLLLSYFGSHRWRNRKCVKTAGGEPSPIRDTEPLEKLNQQKRSVYCYED